MGRTDCILLMKTSLVGSKPETKHKLNGQDRLHVLDEDEHAAHRNEGCQQNPLERPVKMHIEAHGHVIFKVLPLLVRHLHKNRRVLSACWAWHLFQILPRAGVLFGEEIEVAPYRYAHLVFAPPPPKPLNGALIDNLKAEHHSGATVIVVVSVLLQHKDALAAIAHFNVVVADLTRGPCLERMILYVGPQAYHIPVHGGNQQVHLAVALGHAPSVNKDLETDLVRSNRDLLSYPILPYLTLSYRQVISEHHGVRVFANVYFERTPRVAVDDIEVPIMRRHHNVSHRPREPHASLHTQ